MMSQNKKDILAERMRRIQFEMKDLQKDLTELRDDYEEGSEEDLYLRDIVDEQERSFEFATQWFEELIYFLENGKIKECEYDEETERMFREQEEGLW